jgi:hypothetical protein
MSDVQSSRTDAPPPSFISEIDAMANILNEVDGLACALVAAGQARDIGILSPEKIMVHLGTRIEKDVQALRRVSAQLLVAHRAGAKP